MDKGYDIAQEDQTPDEVACHKRAYRLAEVKLIEQLHTAQKDDECSLRAFCRQRSIPESTVRHWLSRMDSTTAQPELIALAESPWGLAFLHRIYTAATFVMAELLPGGYREVSLFLELSGLSEVIAAGYGTQHAFVKTMEETMVTYGEEEKARLGAQMLPKAITAAQDENFHSKHRPCLVAIEPVSNFIITEQHAADRTTKSWDEAMASATKGLRVIIVQSTSDEGKSVVKHAVDSLQSHHSPDLFHPQQDISRATSLPLEQQVKASQVVVVEAQKHVETLLEESREYEQKRQGPERPRDYEARLQKAREAVSQTQARLEKTRERRRKVREAAHDISDAYHPFELKNGEMRDAEKVQADLEKQFGIITQVAQEAEISPKRMKQIEKAHRLVPQMVATIALTHTLIRAKIEALGLSEDAEIVVLESLVPALYLEEAAHKAATAEKRAAIGRCAYQLHERCYRSDSPLTKLDADERYIVEEEARECAQLFQRSSSCVEGRNGVLALLWHGLHRLLPRKLAALTVVHNYFRTRPDGTTAAGRFFGRCPQDLFVYLLDHLPMPARPAAKRLMLN